MFTSYRDLLDVSHRFDGMWHTITHAVNQAATENYKSKHCGRYNARGIEKEEDVVASVFLSTVNAALERDLSLTEVAGLILDQRPHTYIAWAVAQRLKGKV
jgi:hypothetical protein